MFIRSLPFDRTRKLIKATPTVCSFIMPFLERKQQTLVKEKCLESVTATACVVSLGLLYIKSPNLIHNFKLIPFQLKKTTEITITKLQCCKFSSETPSPTPVTSYVKFQRLYMPFEINISWYRNHNTRYLNLELQFKLNKKSCIKYVI